MFKLTENKIIWFVSCLTLFIAVLNDHVALFSAVIAGLILIYFFGRKFLLLSIIVMQISLTGENLVSIRPYLTAISFIILIYFFIKDFGLDYTRFPKVPKIVLIFIAFTLFVVLISSIFSIDMMTSLYSLLRFILFFIFCYLIFSMIKSTDCIVLIVIPLFISIVIVGISMFYEFYEKGAYFFIGDGELLRLAGIYENPNYVGLLLAITIPISISYLMNYHFEKIHFKVLLILFSIFQISLLLLADSRASFLAVALSSIVIFLFSPLKSKIWFGTLIISIFLIIILFIDVSFLIDIFLRPERVGTRDLFWQSGIEVIKNNLIFGTGAGTFEKVFYLNASSTIIDLINTNSSTGGTPHPHNLSLYFWAENGILGLINVLMFFYVFGLIIIKVLKQKIKINESSNFPFLISVLGILIGALARSFFEITGIITYGFLTRDLPLWIILIVTTYIYQIEYKKVLIDGNQL